jgi:hypothetical protein
MFPRRNWDSPNPSSALPPPRTKGGGAHPPAAKGVGESQFRRLEKSLALCLLCDPICLDEGCVMKIKRLNGTFAMMSGGQRAKCDSCEITQLIIFCNSMLKFATGLNME